jgi:hypothetical protein
LARAHSQLPDLARPVEVLLGYWAVANTWKTVASFLSFVRYSAISNSHIRSLYSHSGLMGSRTSTPSHLGG